MSELPVVDSTRVAKKLLANASDYMYQVAQLEVLAESLRIERDSARNERDIARSETGLLRSALETLEQQLQDDPIADVQNISSLPEEGRA